MLEWSENKRQAMERLSTPEGIITALAIDQRGALKKMMSALGMEATKETIDALCLSHFIGSRIWVACCTKTCSRERSFASI